MRWRPRRGVVPDAVRLHLRTAPPVSHAASARHPAGASLGVVGGAGRPESTPFEPELDKASVGKRRRQTSSPLCLHAVPARTASSLEHTVPAARAWPTSERIDPLRGGAVPSLALRPVPGPLPPARRFRARDRTCSAAVRSTGGWSRRISRFSPPCGG